MTMQRKYDYRTGKTSPNKNSGRSGQRVSSITIHHWGGKGQKHQNVVDWLCNPDAGTSAHYVASAGRVDCIVAPHDTAWHAGSRAGNRSSIGIECRPECSDGDFETVAQLVADLWAVYGTVPLVPHKRWTPTQCPGDWSIPRLTERAREILSGTERVPQRVAEGLVDLSLAMALQEWLGVQIDGKVGHKTWKALQKKLGVKYVDGIISYQSHPAKTIGPAITQGWRYTGPKSKGSRTVRALQELVGVKADGVWGPDTTRALRKYLQEL